MPIVAIRPEPGLAATLALAREMGLDVQGVPLSRAEPLDWELPLLDSVDGLLLGSANALRLAGDKLDQLRHLPVLAVGAKTAQAAQTLGFSVEKVGAGGLQSLLDRLERQPRSLIRLAGEENIPLDLPPWIKVATCPCYRISFRPFPPELSEILCNQCLVMLHSAGSARHFAAECDRLSIDRKKVSLAALGPRILQAAGDGWSNTEYADQPNDTQLLALVRQLCH